MHKCIRNTEFHNPILQKNGKYDTTIMRSGYPKTFIIKHYISHH